MKALDKTCGGTLPSYDCVMGELWQEPAASTGGGACLPVELGPSFVDKPRADPYFKLARRNRPIAGLFFARVGCISCTWMMLASHPRFRFRGRSAGASMADFRPGRLPVHGA